MPPLRSAPVASNVARDVPAIALPAVPGHFDRELGRLLLESFEPPYRPAADYHPDGLRFTHGIFSIGPNALGLCSFCHYGFRVGSEPTLNSLRVDSESTPSTERRDSRIWDE